MEDPNMVSLVHGYAAYLANQPIVGEILRPVRVDLVLRYAVSRARHVSNTVLAFGRTRRRRRQNRQEAEALSEFFTELVHGLTRLRLM